MGQQISALVESFDNDAEKEKLANDALNSLVELAKLQIAAFGLAIRYMLMHKAHLFPN